jgi:hypothetical protein
MKTIDTVDKPKQPETKQAKDKPLRARPIKGEVDHEALSREFMARFPKLRAALAK